MRVVHKLVWFCIAPVRARGKFDCAATSQSAGDFRREFFPNRAGQSFRNNVSIRKKEGGIITSSQDFATATEKHLQVLFFFFHRWSYRSGKHQERMGGIIWQLIQRTFPTFHLV